MKKEMKRYDLSIWTLTPCGYNIPFNGKFTKTTLYVKMWILTDKTTYVIEYSRSGIHKMPADYNPFEKYGINKVKREPWSPGNNITAQVDKKTCIKIARDVNPQAAKEIFPHIKLTTEELGRIEANIIKVA
jgi:hypothetical protein